MTLPDEVQTVAELIDWLKQRSPRHALAFANAKLVRCAIDQEFSGVDAPIARRAGNRVFSAGDGRLACGGFCVQAEDFDAGAELALLADAAAGGIASFIGIVRAGAEDGRRVRALTLEHYPGMTEKALDRIVDEAERRWELTGCTVIHRIGRLLPGENIVFVARGKPAPGGRVAGHRVFDRLAENQRAVLEVRRI